MLSADRVWYVAYGSNLHGRRFFCYLEGGIPPGGRRPNPGARDRTPPADTRPVWMPGRVYFARHSTQWDGAIAFYDTIAAGRAAGRAYLITAEQFVDVVAQETRRAPGSDLALPTGLQPGDRAELGDGWYETIVRLDDVEGRPALTFTCPWAFDDVEVAAPSGAYLAHLATGLAEAWGWDRRQVASYLVDLPGVAPTWSREAIEDLVG